MNGLHQDADLAELIFEYRNDAHMSQQEVADGVGVSRTTEYRWEHGLAIPSITNIRRLADVLKIPEQRMKPLLAKTKKRHQTVKPGNCSL